MNGLFLAKCVIVLEGTLAGQSGTAIKYRDHTYTVQRVVYAGKIPLITETDVHETNLKECEEKK